MSIYPPNTTTPKSGNYVWNWLGSSLKRFAAALSPYMGGGDVGYKKYVAKLTQTGTNPPVATVLENTIGTMNWVYEGQGQYSVAVPGYVAGKIVVFTGAGNSGMYNIIIQGYENTFSPFGAWIDVSDLVTGLSLDGALSDTPIEIRVYP